jgi:ribose/xylose/arabinose/galactoside ABC-type transport system permease subunit
VDVLVTPPVNTAVEDGAGGGPSPDAARAQRKAMRVSWAVTGGTFVTFMLVFVIYSVWLGDRFAASEPRLLDLHQNVPVILLGMAATVGLIARQFDLSIAAMATLASYLTIGLTSKEGLPFALVLLIVIAVAIVAGMVNALLVVRLKINAFIATLASGGVLLGISDVYSGGTTFSPSELGRPLPTWFSGPDSLGSFQGRPPSVVTWGLVAVLVAAAGFWLVGRVADRPRRTQITVLAVGAAVVVVALVALSDTIEEIPWTVIVLLVVAFLLSLLLGHTLFGRYLYATGSNEKAARLAGVDVERKQMTAFVMSALLAASGGVMLAANQGSAAANVGDSFLLPAFAAAFLSTVMLSAGRFHIWGTVLGGAFLTWVSQGLIVGGVPFTWTSVINGVVLAAAVALSSLLRQRIGAV